MGLQVGARDLLSYVFALLAAPTYVEKFSEELTIPGPRLPITKNGKLFTRAVEQGRKLIWLQTFGQRFVPEGSGLGEVPQGQARCLRGIPTSPDGYPDKFSYHAPSSTLYVGEGVFSPVLNGVWTYSVSGLEVLRSWLSYRMRSGAGRSSSPLDEIRPSSWTGQMTQELLEFIWVLEATLAMLPELSVLLDEVIGGETFRASELPTPTEDERRAPAEEEPELQQEIDLGS